MARLFVVALLCCALVLHLGFAVCFFCKTQQDVRCCGCEPEGVFSLDFVSLLGFSGGLGEPLSCDGESSSSNRNCFSCTPELVSIVSGVSSFSSCLLLFPAFVDTRVFVACSGKVFRSEFALWSSFWLLHRRSVLLLI